MSNDECLKGPRDEAPMTNDQGQMAKDQGQRTNDNPL